MTDDLVAFIKARLDEDEQIANDARPWQTGSRHEGQPFPWSRYLDWNSPTRLLREVEVKRTIVRQHVPWTTGTGLPGDYDCSVCTKAGEYPEPKRSSMFPCLTMRALASCWASHPDYQEEWAIP